MALVAAAALLLAQNAPPRPLWDTESDTWAATDGLGRTVPGYDQVGPPRSDRFVGIFYFLWLGAHVNGGPYDISKILAKDPNALQHADDPNWGHLHVPHHWGESVFGYYRSDDDYVIRKHAQMLSDAGVDVIIFDTSNSWTYSSTYLKLLKIFSQVRAAGGKTPQIAFLCPFGDPQATVRQLFADLYGKGIYRDLWFKWKGKPLILADSSRLGQHNPDFQQKSAVRIEPGHSLGQSFAETAPLTSVGVNVTRFGGPKADFKLSIFSGEPSPTSHPPVLAERDFRNVEENSWQYLSFPKPLPAGTYTVEISNVGGTVGWWRDIGPSFFKGRAFVDRTPAAGPRSLDIDTAATNGQALEDFFTFRAPQPDYFIGPTRPDMWSWLEVYPQHVFPNSLGQKEQMSVGVAQNAVNGVLGAMSERGAQGRNWHNGAEDAVPDAIYHGYNLAEQFERALKEDPEFIFVTGWNEWTAGRFDEFNGVKLPVIFVDEFDQEFSRDIEPMTGGHGDDYYYELVSYIRRYKGVHPVPSPSGPKSIDLGGGFDQWSDVRPEFRSDYDAAAHRGHAGYNNVAQYTNFTGRNNFVLMKVARDAENVYFYAGTEYPISPADGSNWMNLLIDTGTSPAWEGYRFLVEGHASPRGTASLERSLGGWHWQTVDTVRYRVQGNELQLAIPRKDLGLVSGQPFALQFKWIDNMQRLGDIMEFIVDGDVAPSGRFKYVYKTPG